MSKRKLIPYKLNEHIISTWLYEAGYKRTDVAKLLRIAPKRLHKVLSNPSPYLTIDEYQVIANAVNRTVINVVGAVIFNLPEPPKNKPDLWMEEPTAYEKV